MKILSMITYLKYVPTTDLKKSRRITILAVKLGAAWTMNQNVGIKDGFDQTKWIKFKWMVYELGNKSHLDFIILPIDSHISFK